MRANYVDYNFERVSLIFLILSCVKSVFEFCLFAQNYIFITLIYECSNALIPPLITVRFYDCFYDAVCIVLFVCRKSCKVK